MGFKEKLNSAANVYQEGKKAIKQAPEVARQLADKARALNVDLDEAKKDPKFLEFKKQKAPDADWDKNQLDIKEAYVWYQRAEKASKEYTKLYDEKLKGLILKDKRKEIMAGIEEHMKELALNNPEELRRITKLLEDVQAGNKKIAEQQTRIDQYKAKGGEAGLKDQLDTIKQAQSFKRILASFTKLDKFGLAKKEMLAYQKVKEDFGLRDKESINKKKVEIKKDLKEISKAEKEKLNIQTKYAAQRGEIFLDNETAQLVNGAVKEQLLETFSVMWNTDSIEKMNKGMKLLDRLKKQYIDEGKDLRKPKESYASELKDIHKTFEQVNLKKGQEPREEFWDVEDLRGFYEILNDRINEQMDKNLNSEVENTPLQDLDGAIQKYIKQAEFAGHTPKESAKRVHDAFTKIKDSMQKKDPKWEVLNLALSKYERLTI